jgi:PKD repeat protein
VNGNGRTDFADVVLFFAQMDWIAANEPFAAFDFNANGRIDFADAVRLFDTLGAPVVTPIVAAFTMDRTTGAAPLAVAFTSTSTGPFDDLAWTISSGQTAIATLNGTAPTYTFQAAGSYTVALASTNASTNESATVTQTVTVTAPPGPNRPYPAAHPVPGKVEAEDYDVSVSCPAYADTTSINEGGAYRTDAVDIEALNRNYNIGWIRKGEYLNYSVDAAAAGTFALTMNVANVEPKTEPVRIYLDGVPAGEVRIGLSSNLWTFREFAASAPITIPEGRHVLTVSFEKVERMNFDWMNLAAIAPTPTVTAVPEAPYPTEHVLPVKIEAEHFDAGGEGVAYHDLEPSNLGNNKILRTGEGVDIETAGGVTDVCFVRAGEFLNYSVDTTAADDFTLALRAANPEATTKAVRVYLDGAPAGQVPIGPTGGWTAYREFSASARLALPPGRHVVTIAFEGVNRLNFDWLSLAAAAPTATPTPTPNATDAVTPTATVTPSHETPTPTPTPRRVADADGDSDADATATPGSAYSLTVTGLDLVNEWVSIRNTGDAGVNLQGCTLSNEGSTRVYTFPSFVLEAGATVTVHSDGGTDTGTALYWGIGSSVWNDYSDTATLKRPDGTVISAMARMAYP